MEDSSKGRRKDRNRDRSKDSSPDRHSYDDIIALPHHVSKTHPRMPVSDRAAQFSPFAALTGHAGAIKETARLTDDWMEPEEDSREEMDRKLPILQEHLGEHPEVTITYFLPDDRKDGGSYQTITGAIKKIDTCGCRMIMEDGTVLPMRYIVQLDSELFV